MAAEFPIYVTVDPSKAKQGADQLDNVLGSLSRNSKRLQKELHDAFDEAGTGARKATGPLREYKDGTTAAERAAERLAQQIKREADVLERIQGPYREHRADIEALIALYRRGEISAREYTAEIERMNRAIGMTKSARAANDNSGVAGGILSGAGVGFVAGGAAGVAAQATQTAMSLGKGLMELGDDYVGLGNRINQVSKTEAQHQMLMERTLDIANRSRADWKTTGELFVRMTTATKDLGLSQDHVLRLTETIGKAFAMSGASASEAASGMLQLSQALASGRLQGDEFRSIAENVPIVLDLLAKEMGVTRGELKALGSEGKITADVIVRAFDSAQGSIETGFSKSVPTLAQSFTVFKNEMMATFGPLLADLLPKLGTMLGTIGKTIGTIVSTMEGLMKNSPIDKMFGEGATSNALTSGLLGTVSEMRAASNENAADSWLAQLERLRGDGLEKVRTEAEVVAEVMVALGNAIEKVTQASRGLKEDTFWSNTRETAQYTGDLVTDMAQLKAVIEATTPSLKQQMESYALLPAGKQVVQELGEYFAIVRDTISDAAKELGGFTKLLDEDLATHVGTLMDDLGALGRRALIAVGAPGADPWNRPDISRKSTRAPTKKRDVWADVVPEVGFGAAARLVGGEFGDKVDELLPSLEQLDEIIFKISEHLKNQDTSGETIFDKLIQWHTGAGPDELQSMAEKLKVIAGLDPWDEGKLERMAQGMRNTVDWNRELEQHRRGVDAVNESYETWLAKQKDGGARLDRLGKKFAQEFGDDAAQFENVMVNAFKGAEDAFVDFVKTGKMNWDQLVDQMLSDMIRLTIRAGLSIGLSAAGVPGFATGGSFLVGGSGGTDSQMVTFRATPGERVTIQTPAQQSSGMNAGQLMVRSGATHIHNHLDPMSMGRAYLNSPQGRRHIANIIRADRDGFRASLGLG